MFLNDKLKIKLYSGNGGNGKVSFFKKKNKNIPNGGDGGDGGDIFFEIDDNLDNINYLKKKIFFSKNGLNGDTNFKKGKNGKNLIIKVPKGILIKDIKNNKIILNLYNKFKKILALKGGKGGKGNYFCNKKYYKGLNGSNRDFELEHNIFSNIILLGLPNSGKSSFINIITNVNSCVNNYCFSTLFPKKGNLKLNLFKKLSILDLPGFIKNSFNGLGLGLFFLKHINYTNILFHFIDLYLYKYNFFFKIINNELYKYNKYYFYKPRILFLNKFDLLLDYFNKFNFKEIFKINNFYYYIFFISSKKKIYYKKIFKILYKIFFNNESY
ncbi:GTPase involved in chromosome partitioning and ribosome assembly [Candidatus Nasuia deltocephalinicola]|nr:GTPase involved in chromosome partitioning and ribosome assembly [Candidatus Nasuia deltocephalinicola]